ncbi:MAG: hypothetical protein JO149_09225 [Gammaproteobacteria bacterium]|nr:hypothetical protein [Gammaproteobacteria bacterium]
MSNTRLSDPQKNIIHRELDHLFDFSDEKEKIPQIEKELHIALMGEIPNTQRFYWLRESLLNPTAYFQTLEQQGTTVTIAEVQEYIIDYIIENTERQGFKRLNKAFLLKELSENNGTIDFKSGKAKVIDHYDPWEFPASTHEKIYSFIIRFVSEIIPETLNTKKTQAKRIVYVDTTVRIASMVIEFSKRLYEMPEIFSNDAAANKFIDNVKKEAQIIARDTAAAYAITCLTKKIRNIEIHTEAAIKSELAKDLISNSYYFNLLAEEKILFMQIAHILPRQAENLSHPSIIKLLKLNLLTPKQARFLTPYERAIMIQVGYLHLLMEKKIFFIEIKGISKERSQFLLLPAVTHLIQSAKWTFQQALAFPAYLTDIFKNQLYVPYSMKNGIPPELILIPESHVPFLLKPSIARLITNNIITFKMMATLSINTLTLIGNHPQLIACAEKRLLSAKKLMQINDESLLDLYAATFAERLFAVIIHQPHFIIKRTDNIETLHRKMQEISEDLSISQITLQQQIVQQLLVKIKHHIEQQPEPEKHEKDIYEQFSCLLSECDHNKEINWFSLLAEIVNLAKITLANISRQRFLSPRMQQA